MKRSSSDIEWSEGEPELDEKPSLDDEDSSPKGKAKRSKATKGSLNKEKAEKEKPSQKTVCPLITVSK